MTRAKISEYDAVAANNTDVNGVNIAENCPPSGMNNMGREIMAALKRFQVGSDGDGVTVGGNLVVSGSSTVNTFTAGPVSATTLNTSGAVVFNDAGADVDFRVEGDTDANLLFVDASADAVLIGTNTTTNNLRLNEKLAVVNVGTFGGASLTGYNGASALPVVLDFNKSRGSSDGSMTVVANADELGAIVFRGADGTQFQDAAVIACQVDGTPGAGDMPGRLVFKITPDGSPTPVERMRIDSSGNVLVGTTTTDKVIRSNAQKLLAFSSTGSGHTQVAATSYPGTGPGDGPIVECNRSRGTTDGSMTAVASGDTIGYFMWRGSDGTNFKDTAYIMGACDGTVATNQVPGRIQFFTASSNGTVTERARITSGGYFKASNNGSYISSAGTYHEMVSNQAGSVVTSLRNTSTSDPYGIYVDFTGTDPNNATNYMFRAEISGVGNVYTIFSNGTTSARSDAKWKKNIETARDGYIDDLARLRVVKYNWYNHEDGTPKEMGLIAQEVEEVFPGLVQEDEEKRDEVRTREIPAVLDEDGNEVEPARTEEYTEKVGTGEYTKSIKFSVFTPMLIKAVQELKAITDTQAQTIAALEARIAALENA